MKSMALCNIRLAAMSAIVPAYFSREEISSFEQDEKKVVTIKADVHVLQRCVENAEYLRHKKIHQNHCVTTKIKASQVLNALSLETDNFCCTNQDQV